MITMDLADILDVCCQEFEVSIEEVKGHSLRTEIVYCRAAFIVIAKEHFGLCNRTIGEAINRKQHSVKHLFENQPNTRYYKLSLLRIRKHCPRL